MSPAPRQWPAPLPAPPSSFPPRPYLNPARGFRRLIDGPASTHIDPPHPGPLLPTEPGGPNQEHLSSLGGQAQGREGQTPNQGPPSAWLQRAEALQARACVCTGPVPHRPAAGVARAPRQEPHAPSRGPDSGLPPRPVSGRLGASCVTRKFVGGRGYLLAGELPPFSSPLSPRRPLPRRGPLEEGAEFEWGGPRAPSAPPFSVPSPIGANRGGRGTPLGHRARREARPGQQPLKKTPSSARASVSPIS